jgi:hypothetical protein
MSDVESPMRICGLVVVCCVSGLFDNAAVTAGGGGGAIQRSHGGILVTASLVAYVALRYVRSESLRCVLAGSLAASNFFWFCCADAAMMILSWSVRGMVGGALK